MAGVPDALLRAMLDQLPGPTALFAPDGQWLWANDAAQGRWVAYRSGENLLADPASASVLPALRAGFQGALTLVAAATAGPLETPACPWAGAIVSPVRDAAGAICAVTLTAPHETVPPQLDEQIRAREEEYGRAFEALAEPALLTDELGRITTANAAAWHLHGVDDETLCALALLDLVHPDDRGPLTHYLANHTPDEALRTEVRYHPPVGPALIVELSANPITFQGSARLFWTVRDVTAREVAYQALEERVVARTEELALLLEMTQALNAPQDLAATLDHLLGQAHRLIPYDAASIYSMEGPALLLLAHRGVLGREQIGHFRIMADPSEVIQRGMMTLLADAEADTPEARRVWALPAPEDRARFAGLRGFLGLPLFGKEGAAAPLGRLVLRHRTANFFTPHHIELAQAIANQVGVLIENAHLFRLGQEIAALEERQRLARELHDSVAQLLYGVGLNARIARMLLTTDPPQALAAIEEVRGLAAAGLAEMRALIFELRPESLAEQGLVVVLTRQAEALRARHDLTVTLDLGPEPALPLATKEALYRIAQEALQNVVKHAQARQVTLSLQFAASTTTLTVRDDGVGFDPQVSFPGHFGLRSMRERVARLSGTLTLTSAPGAGTTLVVVVSAES